MLIRMTVYYLSMFYKVILVTALFLRNVLSCRPTLRTFYHRYTHWNYQTSACSSATPTKSRKHKRTVLSGTAAFIPHNILKSPKLVSLATRMRITPSQQSAFVETLIEESGGDTSKVALSYAPADCSRGKVVDQVATSCKEQWTPPKLASLSALGLKTDVVSDKQEYNWRTPNLGYGNFWWNKTTCEFVELCLVYLGAEPSTTYKRPGALHKGRWMAKLLYAIKMCLLEAEIQQLPAGTVATKSHMGKLRHFATIVYSIWWLMEWSQVVPLFADVQGVWIV